jgi:hypothetical protein
MRNAVHWETKLARGLVQPPAGDDLFEGIARELKRATSVVTYEPEPKSAT